MIGCVLAACAIGQPSANLPPLGTNLAGVSDWTTEWPFVDAMKISRPWVSQKEGAPWGQGGPLEVDELGDVKSLKPGQYAETVMFSNGHNPKGAYTLTWKGVGEFDAHLGSKLEMEAPGKAKIQVDGDKGVFLMLKKVDPADPPHDIHLFMPGYNSGSPTYHPIFLQRMSLYRSLRFMDWGATNGNPLKHWSDRPTVQQRTYSGPKGVPLEAMIDLANTKRAIPWFCVPHEADDDYVAHMAELIKQRLLPGLRVIVEYSNECWNTGFEQARWCQSRGKELGLAPDDGKAGLRFYSRRSVEVFAIFEKVFGGASRLIRVLSAQSANPSTGEEVLNWEGAWKHADCVGVAPYFGYEWGTSGKAEATKAGGLTGLFDSLTQEIDGQLKRNVDAYASMASQKRLALVAYEGGQHLVGIGPFQDDADLNSLFDQANRSDKMREAYLQSLKSWRRAGGSLFMHFTDCAPNSKYGRWGAIEYQDQDPQSSVKNVALVQFGLFPDR